MTYLKKLTSRKLQVTAAAGVFIGTLHIGGDVKASLIAGLALAYVLAEAWVDGKAAS